MSGDMDIILFHPAHVHVPTPHISPSKALSKRSTSPLSSKPDSKPTKAERESSLLTTEVVQPLKQCGLIAATLSIGVRKWQGVVRLPERNKGSGLWKETSERVKLMEADEGLFRRMDLK
jgi:DNA polymerase beta